MITLRLVKTDTNVIFDVADNGVGVPPGFDIKISDSLGLQLVNALVQQVGGNIQIDHVKGTRCVLEFPLSINDLD